MQRRVALLAALVVLAGCAGPADRDVTTGTPSTVPASSSTVAGSTAGTASPTVTTTPTTVATSTTPSATTTTTGDPDGPDATTARPGTVDPPPDSLPPGVDATGVENATALVTSHFSALETTGWRHRYEATNRPSVNRSRTTSVTTTVTVAAGVESYREVAVYRGTARNHTRTQRYDRWNNGTFSLVRTEVRNRTDYRQGLDRAPERAASDDYVSEAISMRSYLRVGEFVVADVNRTGDGNRVRLVADDGSSEDLNVSRFDATAVVDGDGRIHRFTVALVGETGGRELAVEARYRLTAVGVPSVAAPEWLDAALAATNATTTAG